MGYFKKLLSPAASWFFWVCRSSRRPRPPTFDGNWNVQIASSNSACNAGTSVSIGISNGQVASNNAMVAASGRVAEAGSINVTLISGIKRAVGFGHLAGASGSGTWRAALCSGTWVAQRN